MAKKKKKRAAPKPPTIQRPKEFLDLIAPGAIQFNTDNFVFGNTYRTVMMLRGYPPTTEEKALLRQLGELEGVTVHLAVRKVSAAEEEAILHAATNKSLMERSNVSNVKQSVTAEAKLQDTASLILGMRRDREPLLHTSVFLELTARNCSACGTASAPSSCAASCPKILCSCGSGTAFYHPTQLAETLWGHLRSGSCPPPARQISFF